MEFPDRRRLPAGRRHGSGGDLGGVVDDLASGAEVDRRTGRKPGGERVVHENGAGCGVVREEHGVPLDQDPAPPCRWCILRLRVDGEEGADCVERTVLHTYILSPYH